MVSKLLFADDKALVADSTEKLQELVTVWECDRRKKAHVNRCKVMRCCKMRLNGLKVYLIGGLGKWSALCT